MENVMKNGFAELSAMEMNEIDGGGSFGEFCYYAGYTLGVIVKNVIRYNKPIIC
jgi:hypothetical protein